jgi:hypothetical protein
MGCCSRWVKRCSRSVFRGRPRERGGSRNSSRSDRRRACSAAGARNASSRDHVASNECCFATAVRHRIAVSHDRAGGKHKSSSVGAVDQTAGVGAEQPRSQRQCCGRPPPLPDKGSRASTGPPRAQRRQSQSSGTAPGAPNRRDRRVAEALAHSASARTRMRSYERKARGAPSWPLGVLRHRRADCSLTSQCGRAGSPMRLARLRLKQPPRSRDRFAPAPAVWSPASRLLLWCLQPA